MTIILRGKGCPWRKGRYISFKVLFPALSCFNKAAEIQIHGSQHAWEVYGPLENCPILSAWEEAGDLTHGAVSASIIQVHARPVILLDVRYVTHLAGVSVGWEFL